MNNPLVLVAHGSRDPRSATTMRALARACARRWPAPVTAAFLDFNAPTVPLALRRVACAGTPVVVPALLTHAYHGRVDVPELLSSVGVGALLAPVLGPTEPSEPVAVSLVEALVRRLSELDTRFDGVALAAAGTSYAAARSTVDNVGAELAARLNVACSVGYASTSGPCVADAVDAVRASGAARILMASYFLAPGRLHDAAVASARGAGVKGVAAPLGSAPEIVDLVLARARAAVLAPLAA